MKYQGIELIDENFDGPFTIKRLKDEINDLRDKNRRCQDKIHKLREELSEAYDTSSMRNKRMLKLENHPFRNLYDWLLTKLHL